MVSVQLFCCAQCGRVEALNSDAIVQKDRRCDACLIGVMKRLIAQTGPASGDVTKFFRTD